MAASVEIQRIVGAYPGDAGIDITGGTNRAGSNDVVSPASAWPIKIPDAGAVENFEKINL